MLSTLQNEHSLLRVISNGATLLYNDRYEDLRRQEMHEFKYHFKGIDTIIYFDAKYDSVQSALSSIYTTSFVSVLLMVSTSSIFLLLSVFFFSSLYNFIAYTTVLSDSYSLLPHLIIIHTIYRLIHNFSILLLSSLFSSLSIPIYISRLVSTSFPVMSKI